ncbi:MAG: hypothetical protein RIB98_14805 [Acidimicrobiales bacterium]
MNPRLRRLSADAVMLREAFGSHPSIRVTPSQDDPPTAYSVGYSVPGVTLAPGSSQPQITNDHRATVRLVSGYPREKPYCISDTIVFHPNFGARAGDEICIADFWSSGQTLVDIIVKIGEMIQYKSFNVRSPLNAVAARWVDENPSVVPVGDVELWTHTVGGPKSDPIGPAPTLPQPAPSRVESPPPTPQGSTLDLTDLS